MNLMTFPWFWRRLAVTSEPSEVVTRLLLSPQSCSLECKKHLS